MTENKSEMRRLMETIAAIEGAKIDSDVLDNDFEYGAEGSYEDYISSDWREVSEEFFEDLERELMQFGLKVYYEESGGDSYLWKIGK